MPIHDAAAFLRYCRLGAGTVIFVISAGRAGRGRVRLETGAEMGYMNKEAPGRCERESNGCFGTD